MLIAGGGGEVNIWNLNTEDFEDVIPQSNTKCIQREILTNCCIVKLHYSHQMRIVYIITLSFQKGYKPFISQH